MTNFQGLNGDFISLGVQIGTFIFAGPGLAGDPSCDRPALIIKERDADHRAQGLAVEHGLEPVPKAEIGGVAAL